MKPAKVTDVDFIQYLIATQTVYWCYFARQQVNERVQSLTLPNNLQPSLSPLASATGEIMRYTLVGADLTTLKSIEDWQVAREIKSVPGIADVSGFGGTILQYQVRVSPDKLQAFGITLKNVTDAITASNANAGGNFLTQGAEEYVVRGVGLLRDVDDIGNVVVMERGGHPFGCAMSPMCRAASNPVWARSAGTPVVVARKRTAMMR